jgi:putative thioredoxin
MPSQHVVETSADRFEADVVQQSFQSLVVVDFWAAWCGPCRRLAPLLEQLADEKAGEFHLVKADIDQVPLQAAAFGVEGIPAVYAVRGGQVIDSFVGLLTESQLRHWYASVQRTRAPASPPTTSRDQASQTQGNANADDLSR